MAETVIEKIPRTELIAMMRARDGDVCMYPDCGRPLDFTITNDSNPLFVTIDHWFPQYAARDAGWTYEQIWAIDNLKLMHKKCNAKKGDRIPNEDGTLPEKVVKFRHSRDRKATRPGLCHICDNGHNLLGDEVCASCGGDAQAYPRSHFVKLQDCDHEIFWCIWCSIGDIPRTNSIAAAMRQADSTELGEFFAE